jgi:hypothetical protein
MPDVTLSDCARCPVLRICTAHVSDGTWPYDKGIDPCRVHLDRDRIMVAGGKVGKS